MTNAHCAHLNLFDESEVEDGRRTVMDSVILYDKQSLKHKLQTSAPSSPTYKRYFGTSTKANGPWLPGHGGLINPM